MAFSTSTVPVEIQQLFGTLAGVEVDYQYLVRGGGQREHPVNPGGTPYEHHPATFPPSHTGCIEDDLNARDVNEGEPPQIEHDNTCVELGIT